MSTSPSVLVVTKRLGIGGAERHLAQVLPALQANGIKIVLFVLERGGQLEHALEAANVVIEGVIPSGSRWRDLIRAGTRLAGCIRQLRPDLVHFFLPEAYLVGSAIAMLVGIRRTIMSRRSLNHYQRGRPLLAQLERLMHYRTIAVLGNSQAVVDDLIAETGEPDKVGLIRNGVAIPATISESTRQRARSQLGLERSAFVMVFVANLIAYKGHADLIDALTRIAPKLSKPWYLVLIGRDEGIGPTLRDQAVEGGIAKQMIWLGERDDVEDIIPAADLALLVSHQEGFSNALLEAMAHGLATIATAIGGNCDAIEDGRSGLLVPARDPVRLGAAILELSRDADLRGRLGAAARERVISHFSQKTCIERYQRLYDGFADLGKQPVQAIIDGIPSRAS